MGWADEHIAALQQGRAVAFNPKGRSMEPRINSGDRVVVEPLDDIRLHDIVLCEVSGRQYLHNVITVEAVGDRAHRFMIGDSHGKINGWIGRSRIYGRVVSVEGKPVPLKLA